MLIVDMYTESDGISISTLMTNVSSGTDLAMRYFRNGNCRGKDGKLIENAEYESPLTCKHF